MPSRSPKRTPRLQSSTAHKTERRSNSAGIDIPLNWLKSGVGVLLLPCCIIATQSFLSAFSETSAKTMLIQSAELWFFFIGVLFVLQFSSKSSTELYNFSFRSCMFPFSFLKVFDVFQSNKRLPVLPD